jgi:uncharacterized protein (DUF1697 family)
VSRWVLLLRAVNLGPRNKLAMADLKRVLEGLGHGEVKTYLNSGNATFTSAKKGSKKLAEGVETALESELGLSVRAVVLSTAQVQAMVDAVPDDLDGYVVVSVLFGVPDALGLKEIQGWEPETVKAGDGCLYLAYQSVQGSKLTNALIEKRLGVGTTARTPATLRKLL